MVNQKGAKTGGRQELDMVPNIRWRKGDRYIPTLRHPVYTHSLATCDGSVDYSLKENNERTTHPQHAVSNVVSIILIISEARARGFIMSV